MKLKLSVLIVLIGIAMPFAGMADVQPSALFADGMVIQRETKAPVWGTADAGEKVTVTGSWGETVSTTADASGKWMVKLETPKAGGPYTLTIQGNNTVEIKDVLSGEVWFCSGQSNMVFELKRLAATNNHRTEKKYKAAAAYVKKEMETARDEMLRQFTVTGNTSPQEPLETLSGQWMSSSPQTNPDFSGTAYFFGCELRNELDVPVGLILCAWGATRVEPWIPAEAYQQDEEMAVYYQNNMMSKEEEMAEREATRRGWRPTVPSTIFNGMVNPVIPYAIKGAIWYQGEANSSHNPHNYERNLRTMISSWREHWGQPPSPGSGVPWGEFPFYFAQLANYAKPRPGTIGFEGWPTVCDQQRRTLGLKNTGMAVLYDIGESRDVHPHNKMDVGKRLALWALKHDYNQSIPVWSGPLYKSHEIKGDKVIIKFDSAGSGLMSGEKPVMDATRETADPLKHFEICGADRQWKLALAEITEKDTITVSHPEVPKPSVVRYAWAPNPEGANLYNKEGLPASIFTTEAEVPAEVGAVAPAKAPTSRKKSLSGPPLKKNDRIIFLGDSITQLGVKEDGYVTLSAQAIQQAYPDLGLEVIGAGISGNKVPNCQARLERDVLQKKPSVVVIYIGINDVWHWALRKRGGKGFRTGTTPEKFESGLKDMIEKINEVGARVILCTPTVIGEKPDGSNPQDKMLDEYAEISRKVARETKSQLLDLRAACIGYLKQHNADNAERGILTGDRVHMNEAGNRFLSELMLDALNVPDKETMVSLAVAGPKQGDADYPPCNANPRHEKKVKGAVTFAASGKPFDITGLRCEYLSGPLGIDLEHPRLSWVIESERRGEQQTGYRVLVASTAELLAGDKGDMWDSGRVKSDRTINVVYAGKPLKARQQCFWKVRIWDKAGKPSAWSTQARWEMGLLKPQDWRAQWIRRLEPEPESEADHFSDRPVPLLRKEFAMEKPVARARAYISGLGYYELRLNGKRVGDHMLDPGWTTYSKRVLYSTYDVTEHLRHGRNAVGVILGNGWYNPLPLRQWGRVNLREHLTIGQPRVIMQLVIDYADGTSQTVITDGTWKTSQGPILRNNVYLGEVYDARREQPGWDKPDFKESKWQNAVAATESVGPLRAQNAPPIRVTKVLQPVKRTQTKPGTYVFDFGQNFAGWVRLHVKGPAGTTVQLRYGELLYPDGRLNAMTAVCGQIKKGRVQPTPGGPETAWQQDVYTLKGGVKETYTPRFTFHGFRYVEVTGYPGEPPLTALEGHRLNSAVNPSGNFACSNEQFNKIQQMIEWTFLSNLFSVQSDCPHREKWGYGGDIVCSSDTFLLNFDMATFYTKIVHDYADAVRPNGGMTETAPHVGVMDGGLGSGAGPIGWGTAFIQLQWQLYQYYGNRQLMEEQYPVTKQWVEFLRSCAKDHIIKRGLSDHESLVPKPKELTGTAFYYDNVRTLSRIARVLGKTQDAEQYATLADDIKKAFNRQFLKPGTGAYDSATQASQSFALFYDLVPQEERQNALDVLVRNILEKRNGHLTTGIFGTRFMPLVLSDLGRTDVAYTVVNQKEYPGWGHMLERGATTLWEHWKFSDNIFSHNHPMFGSVGEWFVKALAGIQPDPEMVGWDRLIIRPQPAPGLTWAKGEYQTIRGRVASQWRIEGGKLSLNIVIPPNTTATVFVPTGDSDTVRESGKPAAQAQGVKFLRREQGAAVYQVGSGQYRFSSGWGQPLSNKY